MKLTDNDLQRLDDWLAEGTRTASGERFALVMVTTGPDGVALTLGETPKCGRCRHWHSMAWDDGRHACRLVLSERDNCGPPATHSDKAVAIGVDSGLATRPDFGCVLFEAVKL